MGGGVWVEHDIYCHFVSYFIPNFQLNIGKKKIKNAIIIDGSLIYAIVSRNYSTKPSYIFQLKRELKVWKYIFNLFHIEMNELGWEPLNERRKEQRFFKIVSDLVAIPADNNIEYNESGSFLSESRSPGESLRPDSLSLRVVSP